MKIMEPIIGRGREMENLPKLRLAGRKGALYGDCCK